MNRILETPLANLPETSSTARASAAFANADDFLAIGLRPMEFRPGVIRRAMARSAAPLATLTFNQADAEVERKLAQIVITGYRLLDPRRREDSLQRMMLGRIHPQLADEAARIAQAKGAPLTQLASPDGLDAEPFEGIGLLAVNGPATQGNQRGDRLFLHDPMNPWSDSLRSHDLLVEHPWRRASRVTKRWIATRTMAAVAVIAFVVTSLTLWRNLRPNDQLIVEGQSSEVVPTRAITSLTTKPSALETNALANASLNVASVEAAAQSENANGTIADREVMAPVRMDHELAAAFKMTQSLPAEEVLPTAPSAAPASVDVALDKMALAETATSPAITPPSLTPAIITPPAIAADMSLPTQALPTEPPPAVASAEVSPVVPATLASAVKWPVPDHAALASTLAQWDAIERTLAPNDWLGRYNRALDFADDTPVTDALPSVDANLVDAYQADAPESEARRRWVGYTQAASAAVLAGEHAKADQATYRLVDGFDADEWTVTKSVIALTVAGDLRERDAKAVGEWLSHWAARALMAGNLADSAFFNQQIDSVSRGIENQSLHLSTTEFRKTLTTAGRLAEVVKQLETEYPEDGLGDLISPTDHYAAGRYWALIRRDWPRSLIHLSAGSDTRLANLAAQESQLSEMPTKGDLLELARAYAAMAEKSKGWIHDSYLLHADELLSRSDAVGSSSDSLDLARFQKALRAEHEAVFAFAERMKRPSRETVAP